MTFTPPPIRGDGPPPDGLKWIAVDFDDTLATGHFDPNTGDNPIGEPIPGTLGKCRELVEHGYKVVIHTSRPWYAYEAIEAWLNHYGYPFHSIVCGKLQAKAYVDDRNIDVNRESWLPYRPGEPVTKFIEADDCGYYLTDSPWSQRLQITLTEEEYANYMRVMDEFSAWQGRFAAADEAFASMLQSQRDAA